MLRSRTPLWIGLALTLASASAQGQAPPDQLIEEGRALRSEGRDAEALERFQQAYRVSPTARALAQIALAEQALGNWIDAERHLAEVLAMTDPYVEQRRADFEQALVTIREHLGRVELAGGVDGALVLVDGVERGSLPLTAPLTVEAGSIVVEIRADGYHPFQRTLTIAAGQLAREQVQLVALTAALEETIVAEPASATSTDATENAETPSELPAPEPQGGGENIGAIVSFSFAGAGLVMALSFGIATLTEDSNLTTLCGTSCTSEQVGTLRTWAALTDVGFAIALAGATLGLIFLFVGTGGGSSETATAIAPWVSPTGAGFATSGRF